MNFEEISDEDWDTTYSEYMGAMVVLLYPKSWERRTSLAETFPKVKGELPPCFLLKMDIDKNPKTPKKLGQKKFPVLVLRNKMENVRCTSDFSGENIDDFFKEARATSKKNRGSSKATTSQAKGAAGKK